MVHFYGEKLLAPYPNPKLKDHPVSAVRDCLFNIFAAALDIGGRSSICSLRRCHAMVTGTHLSWILQTFYKNIEIICTHKKFIYRVKGVCVCRYFLKAA